MELTYRAPPNGASPKVVKKVVKMATADIPSSHGSKREGTARIKPVSDRENERDKLNT